MSVIFSKLAILIDAILEEFYNTKVGNRSATTNTVEQIIGRKPTSFAQFVRDYVTYFNLNTDLIKPAMEKTRTTKMLDSFEIRNKNQQ